jgi:hypothetical protein
VSKQRRWRMSYVSGVRPAVAVPRAKKARKYEFVLVVLVVSVELYTFGDEQEFSAGERLARLLPSCWDKCDKRSDPAGFKVKGLTAHKQDT